MPRRLRSISVALLAAVALAPVAVATAAPKPPPKQTGPDDAVVIAVLDSGMSPYHWDFLASQMPQAKNRDKSDDVPLTKAPHTWLPGFPQPAAFSSYQPLKLTLDGKDEDARLADLHEKDADVWADVQFSGPSGINYYWVPGTKVIGALTFEIEHPVDKNGSAVQPPPNGNPYFSPYVPFYGSGGPEHGMGTSSVSTGNINGTCPECLLVFIQFYDDWAGNRAIDWAMNQPWIDVITNSYGFHTAGTSNTRDNVYGGANFALQKKVSERGQTIFWSAGNGYENAFVTPNQTLESSQKGPDWIVTVGGTSPDDHSYTGAGKPVDVAGIGESYPSAYDASTVTNGGRFSGTSNATPTVAGTYGRALYLARRALAGRSRTQGLGVIAKGPRLTCGKVRRACELGDGVLTAEELRMALFHAALPRSEGPTPGGLSNGDPVADEMIASEGHGTYIARLHQDDAEWMHEFNRLWNPLVGKAHFPARPKGEKEWFIVDSWCRQHIWGSWLGGYYRDGVTPLPADDPENYPARTAYHNACQALVAPPAVPGPPG